MWTSANANGASRSVLELDASLSSFPTSYLALDSASAGTRYGRCVFLSARVPPPAVHAAYASSLFAGVPSDSSNACAHGDRRRCVTGAHCKASLGGFATPRAMETGPVWTLAASVPRTTKAATAVFARRRDEPLSTHGGGSAASPTRGADSKSALIAMAILGVSPSDSFVSESHQN